MCWVKPGVKRELERIAEREKITLSKTAATALEEWIAQSLHIEHAGIIKPVIRQSIREDMRSYSNRLAVLLVRSLFGVEQTRAIVTNILARTPGVRREEVDEIMEGSRNTAKRNIRNTAPYLKELIEEMKEWLLQGEQKPQEEKP